MAEHPMEIVEWRDANFQINAADFEDGLDSDYIIATIGWTQEREKWLIVIGEITSDGERQVSRIPKENVVSRKRLVVAEDGPLTRGTK